MKRLFVLHLLVFSLSGCALLKKKVDATQPQRTDSGFEFTFNMRGDWFWGKPQKVQYMVGKEPTSDGSTTLAIVRHGPVWTPGGKAASDKEILDSFEKDLENQAKGDRVQGVKSTFKRKKHKGANCLFFDQRGQDTKVNAAMTYEGIVCVHPKRKYHFIFMGLSHRSKSGQLVDSSADFERLIGSLKFI